MTVFLLRISSLGPRTCRGCTEQPVSMNRMITMLRERKTPHAAVGFCEERCEPVVRPANVAGDSGQRRGRIPRPTAVNEMALSAPAACYILARNRVTRRPHRAVRNNQGTAQGNHRADAVMRPPLTLPSPLLASSEHRGISSSLDENPREAIDGP